jgi:hypothetical protein
MANQWKILFLRPRFGIRPLQEGLEEWLCYNREVTEVGLWDYVLAEPGSDTLSQRNYSPWSFKVQVAILFGK